MIRLPGCFHVPTLFRASAIISFRGKFSRFELRTLEGCGV